MGEAREAMDRTTAATTSGDRTEVGGCYAEDAVLSTPDEGELRGRDAVATYLLQLREAFPDGGYEHLNKYEDSTTAIDEGFITGTHTGVLRLPSGESIPPTGRQIRVRSCDIAEVANGVITHHRLYFNPADFAEQLGLG
ncbi:ester cyclase [Lysobacter korlensis]|uniref:Ester cyclase n=1 Tax=Lysobacter korlensis TaxID=553636 RepID=A0ABV6RRQ9_9GAMM